MFVDIITVVASKAIRPSKTRTIVSSVRVKPFLLQNTRAHLFIGTIITYTQQKSNIKSNYEEILVKKLNFCIVQFSIFSASTYFFRLKKSFILYIWLFT